MTWRLPWVSRSEYDRNANSYIATLTDISHRTDALIDMADRQADAAEKRYTDILARYHALKLHGAVVVEPMPAPVVVAPVPPDPVALAIRAQVKANPGIFGLGSHLAMYAAELRAHNLPPDKILERLSRWESSEDLSAPVDSVVAIDGAEDAA